MIIKECNQDYLSETGRRIIERTADRHCKDKYLHSFKYACNESHEHADLVNGKLLILVTIITDFKEKY